MTSIQTTTSLSTSQHSRQYVTFHIGEMFFGLEVLKVQELLRLQEITPIPLAPDVIAGLINMRGQIVTAVDMRRRLGLPARAPDQQAMNIVVRTDDGPVSLLVDEIGDVLEAPVSSHEAPPETMLPQEREVVEAVCKLEHSLLLVLDTARVLQKLRN